MDADWHVGAKGCLLGGIEAEAESARLEEEVEEVEAASCGRGRKFGAGRGEMTVPPALSLAGIHGEITWRHAHSEITTTSTKPCAVVGACSYATNKSCLRIAALFTGPSRTFPGRRWASATLHRLHSQHARVAHTRTKEPHQPATPSEGNRTPYTLSALESPSRKAVSPRRPSLQSWGTHPAPASRPRRAALALSRP